MPDYSDVAHQYDCSGVADLLDGIAGEHWVEIGICGEQSDGKFGTARGVLTNTAYFSNTWKNKAFDPVLHPDFAGVAWFRPVNTGFQGWFAIHDGAADNRKGYFISLNAESLPAFTQYEGTGPGIIEVPSTTLAVNPGITVPTATWQMVGWSHDNTSKELRIFWGRAVDEYYYAAGPGYAAGFKVTVDVQQLKMFGTGQWDEDHVSFWADRSFDLTDFLYHWQNHDGLAFADFGNPPTPPGVALDVVGSFYHYQRRI